MQNLIKMTIREYDEHCEKVISQFLDLHFYPQLSDIQHIERIQDRNIQIKGADIIFIHNDETYYIDEKAAVKYLNLTTFALELSFMNRFGNLCTGWLLDETKINNYFVFVWINKLRHKTIQDITSVQDVDVALVKKEKIIEYLSSLGWTFEKLQNKIQEIRSQSNVDMGNIENYGWVFKYSQQLKEMPINILLPKQKYIELADVYKNISV